MRYVKLLTFVLLLWSNSAMAATLAWNANTEVTVVGYRVYQCDITPCSPGSGNQSLLVSLGKVTTFDIGTPTVTKYYYVTAYDGANLESGGSNVASYTPSVSTGSGSAATPTTTTALANVKLTVVGTPALSAWGVEGTTTDLRDVMATINLDGKPYWTDHTPPYSFPATSGALTTTGKVGNGMHTVEFVFYLEGTTTEIGRANVTVQEGTSPITTSSGGTTLTSSGGTTPTTASDTTQTITPTVSLKVVGNPAAYSWGVEGSTTDVRDVMATIYLDGKEYWTDHTPAYSFPATTSLTTLTGTFGAGTHTVQFVYYLEGTTTEVGRASITVKEGP
jgi:hypothetical protein